MIKVVGLGNVLMGDDGFGPFAVRVLEATWEFVGDVSLEDLGTPGFDLVPHLSDAGALIILDTVHAEGRPGDVRVYDRDTLLGAPPPGPRLGPHDSALKDALFALEFAGSAPTEVVLVGVIPKSVTKGTGLSLVVRAAYPAVEAETLRQLARLGVTARRRARPRDPDLWWEKTPCTN